MRHSLSEPSIEKLIQRRRTLELKRGEILYHAGDKPQGLWAVCSGRVKTYLLTNEGKALITAIAGPGDIIGHRDFINGDTHRDFTESLDDALVAHLDADLVQEFLDTDPVFAQKLLRRLAGDLLDAEERASTIAYRFAKERIIQALDEFNDEADRYDPSSAYPLIVVRRQVLAERAGLTIETTVRMLKQLEQEGKIKIEGRKIRLCYRLRGEGQQQNAVC
ncbi:electron transport regulator A-like [Ylistrum balloti]|uniref:electron transport regulator A-like n=1 Tax=Ylistrum balloti TaxID=509963 RepID=UPI002905D927|nr:electron transport regulator A-like [Ylistrum balloti]